MKVFLAYFAAIMTFGFIWTMPLGGKAEARKYSFRVHVWPTIRRYCRTCHRPKKIRTKKGKKIVIAGQLDLSTRKKAYKNLVNQLSKQTKSEYYLVLPGQPAYSYLLFKLLGNHKQAGGKGKRCPQNRKRRLPAWRINRITKWVQDGARK